MKRTYDYLETKKHLELKKQLLCKKLLNVNLTEEDRNQIKMEIDNYNYILTLVDMNHYERGLSHDKRM
ncbi:DUF3896 family protein [Bacillus pseudomycoides]|uniref:DUF3896 family protein n=1 Tax=Bacillus pseudomycoides TaxID=64104 RepID=UPI001FB3A780|nr:DUF3896 family protein [Bacillus pseudomycoides]